MKAGRELDALVAEKVMGWEEVESKSHGHYWVDPRGNLHEAPGYTSMPSYSTDIAAAWQVVDHFWRNVPAYRALRMESAAAGYIVAFYSHKNPLNRPDAFSHGDTAPLAICLAALKAVGHEVPNEP